MQARNSFLKIKQMALNTDENLYIYISANQIYRDNRQGHLPKHESNLIISI